MPKRCIKRDCIVKHHKKREQSVAKRHVVAHPIVLTLFILYIGALVFVLIVPNNYRGHNVLVDGLTGELWLAYVADGFNLVPFQGIAEQLGSIIAGESAIRNMVYLLGNLVGFMPLGFFLPVLFTQEHSFKVFFFTVFSAIAVLELTQLLTMRGSFDIDDIILNTAGACLGFLITKKMVRSTSERSTTAD